MKHCPGCSIKVGGSFQFCPLCQNELLGEDTESYFPAPVKLKSLSMLYKSLLFAATASLLICLVLDYMIGLHGELHWSILSTIGIIDAEIVAWRLIRSRRRLLHNYITNISVGVVILLLAAAYWLGFWELCVTWLLPSVCLAVTGSLFVLCFIDRKNNVLPYLLSYLVLAEIAPAVMAIRGKELPLLWNIMVLAGAVELLGVVVFKGGLLLNELRKRFHL